MSFLISALPLTKFAHLFDLSDEELLTHGAMRSIVDENPGTPCRVSLEDAAVGESVLLVNYQHQSAATPYQSSYAIFVRENASEVKLQPNVVPEQLLSRLLSVRAFDQDHLLIDADVCDGVALADVIERFFSSSAVSYLHVHNAKQGCYAARVDRT